MKYRFQDNTLPFEERAKDLLSRLTREEKVGMITSQLDDIPRLGIKKTHIGTEIARGNMPAGTITTATYPLSAPSAPIAVQVSVPTSLLRSGQNTIAAYTNLNYRATNTVSFEATLTGVVQ